MGSITFMEMGVHWTSALTFPLVLSKYTIKIQGALLSRVYTFLLIYGVNYKFHLIAFEFLYVCWWV